MPNVSSPLAVAPTAMPLVRADALHRAAGLAIEFATVADLVAAVEVERGNIAKNTPLWADGQSVCVAGEVAHGVRRAWNRSAQHARSVLIRPGLSITLTADASRVHFVGGPPSASEGSDGDAAIDWAANAYHVKAAGAWASGGAIYPVSIVNGDGGGESPPPPFMQFVASAVWDITHGLGRYPGVTAFDSEGHQIEGQIEYLSLNRLVIRYEPAVAGLAYLNC